VTYQKRRVRVVLDVEVEDWGWPGCPINPEGYFRPGSLLGYSSDYAGFEPYGKILRCREALSPRMLLRRMRHPAAPRGRTGSE
jgi:hypothetical protein